MLQLNKKKQNELIDLVDDVLDENNSFNNKIKTGDIYTEDNLFGDTNWNDIWEKKCQKFLMVSSNK